MTVVDVYRGAATPTAERGLELQRPLDVALAAALVALSALTWSPLERYWRVELGRIPVTVAVVASVLFVVRTGANRWISDRTWTPWICAGPLAALTATFALFVHATGAAYEAVGLVLAAFGEEVTFRVAWPLLVFTLLVRMRVKPANAFGVALVTSTLAFIVMPGHTVQITNSAMALTFVAFSALVTWLVWRGPGLLAAVAFHASCNLATLANFDGSLNPSQRAVLLCTAMLPIIIGGVVIALRARVPRLART